MKCPNCTKQNKPGVKNCEYCNELMPVRKKKTSNVNTQENKTAKAKTKNSGEKIVVKKTEKIEPEVKKEAIIELDEEKKAIKKMVKNIKKINKMIYVYIVLIIAVFGIILMVNNKLHTITCEISNDSETEKYNIKLVIKRNENNITGFKYITESTTNSYDETLEARYKIITDELKKIEDYNEIVSSKLKNRSMKIEYNFEEENLDKTIDYINIDLSPYLNNVDSFIVELEKQEIGFKCK